MIKKLFLFTCLFYTLSFIACKPDDIVDPQSRTIFKIDNQSDVDLRYKAYEDANDSFFILIPANSNTEIEDISFLGKGTISPNMHFESLKLRNNENTIVYNQDPIDNDLWNLNTIIYTLTITNALLN